MSNTICHINRKIGDPLPPQAIPTLKHLGYSLCAVEYLRVGDIYVDMGNYPREWSTPLSVAVWVLHQSAAVVSVERETLSPGEVYPSWPVGDVIIVGWLGGRHMNSYPLDYDDMWVKRP